MSVDLVHGRWNHILIVDPEAVGCGGQDNPDRGPCVKATVPELRGNVEGAVYPVQVQ